ncbi:MAG: M3 family metallopeptidase [Gemmatimonadaceae bacterium]
MTNSSASTNPFLSGSSLPFQAPHFDLIKEDDFQPAIEEGMKQQLAEVAAIIADPAAPTFENTLVALEKSGALLNRVLPVFSALTGANTSETLQRVQEYEAPRLAAHDDAIHLDARLFKRIETVHNTRDSLKLDGESRHLLDWYYDEFVRKGARLPEHNKAALKKLNEEESTLRALFTNKLLAASKSGALVLHDRTKLAGMSDAEIAAAERSIADDTDGSATWVIPIHNTTQQPPLASLADRGMRRRLFEASWNRTEKNDANDTRQIVARLAQIRTEQARLLGHANYAELALEDQMARNPETALKFVRDLVPAATANARAEADEIQKMITACGESFELEPWDWDHYAEKVRKARYDLDEEQIKQYFDLNGVLTNGLFYAATQLYGITFTERHEFPVYHPDVRVFEISDSDGSPLALFYCDFFSRENKIGGAWMDNLVTQSKLLGTKPVIYNVANFTKPAPGQAALLSIDDVTTMFHEFGHALHGIFADQQYPSLSGTSVARDFVELPSQFNEHWATEPTVFANYARHHDTGAPMPQALADRIREADKFNQGYRLTEVLAATLLDMAWHTLPAGVPLLDVDAFERQALADNNVGLRSVPPRYRSSYFQHIWSNGYSAAYYASLWAEMLDADAYEWFKENGGLTRANGDHFRATILSRGNTADFALMYRQFRGRDPQIQPMLEGRGLRTSPKQ